MKVHNLKVNNIYFQELIINKKKFEIRKNDRDYKVGDILHLREFDNEFYSGRYIDREITYILESCPEHGLMDGYVILSLL